MRTSNSMIRRLAALVAVLTCMALALSGCSNSPDSVEDPLSQYSGIGVDSLVPFATPDASLWTPAPTEAPATVAPTQAGYADLTFGATGEAVSALQGRLKALGYYGGSIDSKFGESTVSAIKLFQAQMGLQKTGLATAQLQQALFDANAPRYATAASGSVDPYDGPDGDLPDDYEDYTQPAPTIRPTVKPAATRTPDPYEYEDDDTPRELARGDKGDLVKDLQRALKQLGYYAGSIDGDYGSGTATAVKRFQAAYGQNQTGVATLALQKKLYSGDAVPYVTPTPKPTAATYKELAWGDTGSAVTNLQRRLRALGYIDTANAGEFDTKTENGVKRFQRMYDVEETGIATVSLQKHLFSSNALAYKPNTTPKPTATPAAYQSLRPGDTGERVKALQRRLTDLGYFTGEIGGNYLELTTAAVKRFQRAIDVEETGIATASLQKQLFASDAPSYQKPTATPAPTASTEQIAEGDKGDRVTKVQKRLKELGFYTGSVTGGFGAGTTAAVKAFQKACDLRQTGIVTRDLYALIMSDEAPDKTKPAVTPAGTQAYKKLEPGATGERVKALQRRLRELGFFDGDIGGNYLSKTTSAVKAFQKVLGVKQTGIATVDLQEKLFSNSAPMKGESEGEVDGADLKALKYKDTGARVTDLQHRLIELGFLDEEYGGDKSGTYGSGTRQAVIDAQLARGMDSDGNADLEFMRFIMSSAANSIEPIVY